MEIEIRNFAALLALKNGPRRVAYGLATTINETLKAIQVAEREQVRRQFQVRKSAFILREIAVIKQNDGASGFASAKRGIYIGRVAVGTKDRLLLSQFEKGGSRPAFSGASSVAVPVTGGPARPSFGRSVPTGLYVTALALRSVGKALQGAKGTFVIKSVGIFMRTRNDLVELYSFARHVVLHPKLGFLPTAKRVAEFQVPRLIHAQVMDAIRHDVAKGFAG